MSLFFKRIPSAEMGTKYTHIGLFVGCVPVYIGAVDSDSPFLTERNGVPAGTLECVAALFGLACMLRSLVDPHFEQTFWIKITGRFERK